MAPLHSEHEVDELLHENELFIDPMLGTPLAFYIEKDVHDRETLVELIQKNGGTISPAYSGVPYILVDPLLPSGQNLYRQYASKKGKVILDARWVHECIKLGELQTYQTNWADCKVQGNELETTSHADNQPAQSQSQPQPQPQPQSMQVDEVGQITASNTLHSQVLQPPPLPTVDLVHAQTHFQYQMFNPAMHPASRAMHDVTHPPQHTWHTSQSIAPQQAHIVPPPQTHIVHRPSYRDTGWDTYDQTTHTSDQLVGPSTATYDYRYREDQTHWVGESFYTPTYDQPYQPSYLEEPSTSTAPPPPIAEEPEPVTDQTEGRGRKRMRNQAPQAKSAAALVPNRNPPARSPTPPTRVIKSTYGGNLFTAEDIMYLKKYIDYCHDQGLVLSLREICERVAVKAPHHTFYSWRRYCNKHQIKLDGYIMNRPDSPDQDHDMNEEDQLLQSVSGNNAIVAGRNRAHAYQGLRNRSPTPPRALFRSTTGKGVAFTEDDVAFLVRFMEYRSSQGPLDMVAFWKDVATKAPHHSRASWMKFWRRHKHELNRTDTDEPLPQRPEKKMRYSHLDDILLAKYFCNKPEGTSDKVFQAFGRLHPHHPWKGWQEHHRIHKVKIDHLIKRLVNGEDIDNDPEPG